MGAPAVAVEAEEAFIAAMESGTLEVGGDQSLLELAIKEEPKLGTGRGGKPYVLFVTDAGAVNYFPHAKHGRFIALGSR